MKDTRFYKYVLRGGDILRIGIPTGVHSRSKKKGTDRRRKLML